MIGGGDTGSDCIGTSIRQGALSVTNFEIMPQPPEQENKMLTWPDWPLKLRTSSSHEEGAERDFAVMTTKFTGENGHVKKLHCVRVDDKIKPIPGTEFELDADLVLLAMGFVHPVHEGMIKSLGLELDQRGNVKADTRRLPQLESEGVRRRRHAARPVAGGVGDPRRPPSRARGRQVPDGIDARCRARAVSAAADLRIPEGPSAASGARRIVTMRSRRARTARAPDCADGSRRLALVARTAVGRGLAASAVRAAASAGGPAAAVVRCAAAACRRLPAPARSPAVPPAAVVGAATTGSPAATRCRAAS